MKTATLVLLTRGFSVLPAKKKRGEGLGLLNSYGGKVEAGETIEAAAVRETNKESGVIIEPKDLEPAGNIKFFFDNKFRWEVHVFRVMKWQGAAVETEEMGPPKWFHFDKIPYNGGQMWPSDGKWMPSVLEGKKAIGDVFYDAEGKNLLHCDILVL